MREWIVAAAMAFMVSAAGCGSGSRFLRPAPECTCAHNFGGKCRCYHCLHGADDPAARCYCGLGGCECGMRRPGCACEHCLGKPGAEQCKCGTEK